MKTLFTTILAAGLLAFSVSSNAATYNFQSVADATSGTVYGVAAGERGYSSVTFSTFGQLDLTATGSVHVPATLGKYIPKVSFPWGGGYGGYYVGGTQAYDRDAYAYLDRSNAGLGVCQNITTGDAQCNPSSDDNVTFRETLKLTFEDETTLNDVRMVNGDHGTTFLGNYNLTVDGVFAGTNPLAGLLELDLVGTTFEFSNPNWQGPSYASNEYQFYIAELSFGDRGIPQVPVPAAVWLFGSGLIGLVAVARRKKV